MVYVLFLCRSELLHVIYSIDIIYLLGIIKLSYFVLIINFSSKMVKTTTNVVTCIFYEQLVKMVKYALN